MQKKEIKIVKNYERNVTIMKYKISMIAICAMIIGAIFVPKSLADEAEIKEITFNDSAIIKAVNDIAAAKMMKLQDVYDDNIVYLTKAFCKVMHE